ncbi:6,7-dimethyl-8-ribityllumazine synthase [Gracilariopsis chorda]|uniref:6,7-dimethyl-8-ribityllumazine synthase n=1 Tax=Gracilariopsis chorda TaxID=448386 RepID=A0A2V3ISX5_9FLOR|nr:6,7-dimethyl-8-ribityllumazine synthase [Gracilariopsis chorda]|eukprot:PXF45228.1 6,7-dimethyl-8-ribityllumazine synthase [Gracilariopsis chorda]
MGLEFANRKNDEQLRIGIVSTRWNEQYVQAMLSQTLETLSEQGIAKEDIVRMQVAGAYEVPMAARFMAASQKVDAVICLGILIKGETDHYEYIASAVSGGLMDLQLTLQIPMVFGVLCCRTEQQVQDRTTGDKAHASDYAKTAIEMAQLRKSQIGGMSGGKKSVGFF